MEWNPLWYLDNACLNFFEMDNTAKKTKQSLKMVWKKDIQWILKNSHSLVTENQNEKLKQQLEVKRREKWSKFGNNTRCACFRKTKVMKDRDKQKITCGIKTLPRKIWNWTRNGLLAIEKNGKRSHK